MVIRGARLWRGIAVEPVVLGPKNRGGDNDEAHGRRETLDRAKEPDIADHDNSGVPCYGARQRFSIAREEKLCDGTGHCSDRAL